MQSKVLIIIAAIAAIALLSIGVNIGLLINNNPAQTINNPSQTADIPSPTNTIKPSEPTPINSIEPTPSSLISPTPVPSSVGLRVGDSFTYKLTGTSTLQAIDAAVTPGFDVYNKTDYYRVTITEIENTNLTLNIEWRFQNGTSITNTQILDISSGRSTSTTGFWAIYLANLKVGDLTRPTGHDGITINQTDTKTYADGTRTRCFWSVENQFFDINDSTQDKLRYDYTAVYFDQKTGMLEILNNITYYNNPTKTETIIWHLINTSVWNV